jgi:hypothetical protein
VSASGRFVTLLGERVVVLHEPRHLGDQISRVGARLRSGGAELLGLERGDDGIEVALERREPAQLAVTEACRAADRRRLDRDLAAPRNIACQRPELAGNDQGARFGFLRRRGVRLAFEPFCALQPGRRR